MMFKHRIDGVTLDSAQRVMSAIATALHFPAYFGHNLDALYDSLTDLSWLPEGEHILIWSRPGILRGADENAFEAITTVLADAVAEGTGGAAYLSLLLQTD
jgi:RNAse (barnase) inhibitor barstar